MFLLSAYHPAIVRARGECRERAEELEKSTHPLGVAERLESAWRVECSGVLLSADWAGRRPKLAAFVFLPFVRPPLLDSLFATTRTRYTLDLDSRLYKLANQSIMEPANFDFILMVKFTRHMLVLITLCITSYLLLHKCQTPLTD